MQFVATLQRPRRTPDSEHTLILSYLASLACLGRANLKVRSGRAGNIEITSPDKAAIEAFLEKSAISTLKPAWTLSKSTR